MGKKTKVVMALVLMVVMLALASCNPAKDSGQNNDPDATPGQTPSTGDSTNAEQPDPSEYKGSVVYAVFSSDTEYAEKQVEKFNEIYPNINVEIVSFEGNLNEYLTTQAASSSLPDVVYGWENLTYPISQGWVHPLDSFLEKDNEVGYVAKDILASYEFGGKTYALPTHLQFSAVLVNLDLVEQLNMDPPSYLWTLDDFKYYLTHATTDTISGINHLWGFDEAMSGVMSKDLHQMAYNPATGEFNFTEGSYGKALAFQKELKAVPGLISDDLKNDELVKEGKEDDYQKKFGKDADALRESKILAGYHGTWDLSWIRSMNYKYDMYPLPQDPSVGYRQSVHADHAFMTSTAKDPEAAFQFLKWISYGKDGLLFTLDYDKNKTDADGNSTPDFVIPSSSHPDVVAAFEALDFVPGGVKYMYSRLDETFRGDFYKIVPGWDQAFWDVVFPKNEEIRKGEAEASAVAAELEVKANEVLKETWDEFNKQLADVQSEFGK